MLVLLLMVEPTETAYKLETETVDWRLQIRARWDPYPHPDIMIVAVDDASLEKYDRWPWDRRVHAEMLQNLIQVTPLVVALDFIFSEEQSREIDEYFGAQMEVLPSVITGAFTTKDPNLAKIKPDIDLEPEHPMDYWNRRDKAIEWWDRHIIPQVYGDLYQIPVQKDEVGLAIPIEPLLVYGDFGVVDADPGADGVRRKILLIKRVGKYVFPSISLKAVCAYLGIPMQDVRVELGHAISFETYNGKKYSIPIDEHGFYSINYRNLDHFNETKPYHVIGYAKLNELIQQGVENWPQEQIANPTNKIILAGQWATGLSDLGPSPYREQSPLVLVHAQIISNILQEDFVQIFTFRQLAVWWLLLTLITLLAFHVQSGNFTIVFPLLIAFGYSAVNLALFIAHSIQLPYFLPMFGYASVTGGAMFIRWWQERKSREQLKSLFATYVSKSVMNNLLENPDALGLGGVSKPVTIFFSDIRGFTTYSETLEPAELVRQLNEYFNRMCPIIIESQGTLHKFIGDAIMAAWGDVLSTHPEEDARKGVRACLKMRRELAALNRKRLNEGLPPMKIGMGINHGNVNVGNIGSNERKEFTLIGDAVNVASRLEGLTKQFHTDLAVGEKVRPFLKDDFLLRSLGVIMPKGKTIPMRIYEVFGEKGDSESAVSAAWCTRYEEAFENYLARRFGPAREGFLACLQTRHDDFCCQTYLRYCETYLHEPPPESWDGVVILTEK